MKCPADNLWPDGRCEWVIAYKDGINNGYCIKNGCPAYQKNIEDGDNMEKAKLTLYLPIEIEFERHRAYPGEFEKGGIQLSPAEPAFIEVHNAWINGSEVCGAVIDYLNDEMKDDIAEELS